MDLLAVHICIQTGVSFFACPSTGEVSWDPPVGNFVYVRFLPLSLHLARGECIPIGLTPVYDYELRGRMEAET